MNGYADAMLATVDSLGGWHSLPFFHDGSLSGIADRLAADPGPILPPADKVFAALAHVPPAAVRAVIIGQDPYPTPGHAQGLAFSVHPDVNPLPRSLGNIFKELTDDIGGAPTDGDLTRWSDQGVLLLNTALTVRAGDAGSHAKLGWGNLAEQVVSALADRDGLAWVLWGRHAQAYRPQIDAGSGRDFLIVESAHPSPLSARRGFFGSKPFSRINTHLANRGEPPIEWSA